jgi:hypothetical protein
VEEEQPKAKKISSKVKRVVDFIGEKCTKKADIKTGTFDR